MASAITHAIVGAGVGLACAALPGRAEIRTSRLVLLGMFFAVVPDADVVTFAFVDYDHMLGHRGLFHAPAFYAAVSAALTWRYPAELRRVVFLCVFLALISHSLLDALTNGGLGVAFLAPLSGARFFFPWRPIPVSPLSATAFFSARGLHILSVEVFFAAPALVVGWLLAWWAKR